MTECFREAIAFGSPGRRLGGELAYPTDRDPEFAVLLIGPHPYMGGTMRNSLLAAMAEAVAIAGGLSLRFDYAGTGNSRDGMDMAVAESLAEFWQTGHAPEDPGRFDDASAALEHLGSLRAGPLFLVGYSFGAAMAWRLFQSEATDLAGAVFVSPTLSRHDFARTPASQTCGSRARPALVIHSRDDFCTPEPVVAEWTRSRACPIQYSCHAEGNHFFRGAESRIGQEVAKFIVAAGALQLEHVAC